MKFMKHYLDDYLMSGGNEVKSLFDNPEGLIDGDGVSCQLAVFLDGILNVPGYSDSYKESNDAWPFAYSAAKYKSFEDFATDINGTKFLADWEAKRCLRSIPRISLYLYAQYPEYAFPYLLPQHFYILRTICREFDIELPPIPPRNDNIARFFYYVDICRAMYEFRIKHDLSPSELCAFIYGFAMRDVKCIIENVEKEPRNIFMVYASPEDQKTILHGSLDSKTVAVWQGREEIRIGDILLMYEQSPSRSFGSVWTAISPGFDDPFDFFAGKVFAGNPVRIPRVLFSDINADPVWSNKPEVKAHMQGGCGRSCSVEEYEALKTIIKRKDTSFNLDKLPNSPKKATFDFSVLNVEHDVELNLLEPFLLNLGFREKDWTKQYSVRIGRNNASRPDYLIGLGKSTKGVRASLVFEAKLTIPNEKQRRKDHGQAVAYGGILSSSIVTLVSKEGVWIYQRSEEFDFDKGIEYTWAQLEEPEVMVELSQLFRPNIPSI